LSRRDTNSYRRNLCLNSVTIVLSLGFVVLGVGCSLKARQAIVYHALDYPPPAKESGVPVPETLMVYGFLLDPSVDIHSLVVSHAKGGDQSMLYHRWKDHPADMVTELVLRDIQDSGLFEKAVDQMSTARYRYALEGTIRRLQGIARDDKVFATIEAEATLIDFDAPRRGQKVIMQQSYKVEATSQDSSADALVRALDLAVQDFSAKLRADIKAAMEKEVPAGKRAITRKADLGIPHAASHRKEANLIGSEMFPIVKIPPSPFREGGKVRTLPPFAKKGMGGFLKQNPFGCYSDDSALA